MRDPIDPGVPIPKPDRFDAMRAARRRCIDPRHLRAIDVAALILPAIGAVLVMLAFNRFLNRLGFDASGIPLGIASGLLYTGAFAFVYRRRFVRNYYAELRSRGHELCAVCGYWRQGLDPGAPCPECGTAAEPAA